MEKMKKYVLHFVKKTKYVLIAVFLFALINKHLFFYVFFGGLMGLIIVYFFKYIDKDLKIKKE